MYVCVIVLCDRLKPSLDVNVAAVLELERSTWKDMVEEQKTTNKEVPSMWKYMDFKHLVSPTDKKYFSRFYGLIKITGINPVEVVLAVEQSHYAVVPVTGLAIASLAWYTTFVLQAHSKTMHLQCYRLVVGCKLPFFLAGKVARLRAKSPKLANTKGKLITPFVVSLSLCSGLNHDLI